MAVWGRVAAAVVTVLLCGCDDPGASAGSAGTPAASDGSSGDESPFGGDDPEGNRMPNVVCMDLQAAQDEIQDHGVFFSGSTDATGQGRMQVIDSNWVVVDQSPAPGTVIGEGDAELLVVKDAEKSESWLDHPC